MAVNRPPFHLDGVFLDVSGGSIPEFPAAAASS
jgi:hypothetical protein